MHRSRIRIAHRWAHRFLHAQAHRPRNGEPSPAAARKPTIAADFPLQDTRAVGIIAHIDSGKTTTTERMLHYAGMTAQIGNVDEGTTVMDYLEQERERGITIQSAAITFGWREKPDQLTRIHLIDTPGHADFTMEVERALRVLDGAVVILDAVAGPQSQTKNVIRQAQRHSLPFVAFVNKMDREGSNGWRCLQKLSEDVFRKSKQIVVPMQVYVYPKNSSELPAIVDIVSMERLEFSPQDGGRTVVRNPFPPNSNDSISKQVHAVRQNLLDTLADLDDNFLEELLQYEDIFDPKLQPHIEAALRRQTVAGVTVPAFFGTALRNVGVQPVVDAIVKYLPNPLERPLPNVSLLEPVQNHRKRNGSKDAAVAKEEQLPLDIDQRMCALAFKVVHDPRRGPLTYVRVYSGTLEEKSQLLNMQSQTRERISRLLHVYADDTEEISSITAGNIGVIVGLKETKTGDTLLNANDPRTKSKPILLPTISIPPPVFVGSIEPESTTDEKALEQALQHLQREDPSLHVRTDEETGQRLISGMGELHLEIVHAKLLEDWKIKCRLGKMWISYRETLKSNLTQPIVFRYEFSRDMMGTRQRATMRVHVQKLGDDGNGNQDENSVNVDYQEPEETQEGVATTTTLSPAEITQSIRSGIQAALMNGPLAQFPMKQVCVRVDEISLDATTSTVALHACAAESLKKALQPSRASEHGPLSVMNAEMLSQHSPCTLLEPLMDVSVTVPQKQFGQVLSDLKSSRSAQILSMEGEDVADSEMEQDSEVGTDSREKIRSRFHQTMEELQALEGQIGYAPSSVVDPRSSLMGREQTLRARVPLSSLLGYSKSLRSLTQGHGKFSMTLEGYGSMSKQRVQAVLKDIRGF